jgi:dipeptidyl aminopeptidase/acylaminoacyl peptidase
MGSPLTWMPDSRTLVVKAVLPQRGRPPARPIAPTGPNIQESADNTAEVWTFQDLLKNPHDERQFAYYGSCQLTLVETATDQASLVRTRSILATISASPDGQRLLVERVHPPYSYVVPHAYFPREVVWDRTGQILHTLASLPLADAVSTDGVPTGPRSYHWHAAEPATLVWAEALDNGDPKKEVPQRDRIPMLTAPFRSPPVELVKTEHCYASLLWGEQEGVALVSNDDRVRRWRRTFLLDTTNLHQAPRLLFSRDMRDRYHEPGTPLMRVLPTGHQVVRQHRGRIYLSGAGATSEGDRPFLDRVDLTALKADRLFQSDTVSYETVVALLDDEDGQFVTRRKSPSDAPNYVVRGSDGSRRGLTQFADSTPALRGITKRLVAYKRADGIPLAFTLYLPADYQPGTRLPTVL